MSPANWTVNVWIGVGCGLFLALFVTVAWALQRAYEAGRYDGAQARAGDSERRG